MEKKSRTVLDLFCGAGGFSYGFEIADATKYPYETTTETKFDIIGAIDNDKDAIATFNANHTTYADTVREDIQKIKPERYEKEYLSSDTNIDIIIGGPPCKGFSSIRPDRSSDEIDYRNYLYADYLSYIEHFTPEVFVMENVPEIINHTVRDNVKIIEFIFDDIKSLGYEFEWRVLNSVFYGVPQTRSRFILIGKKSETNNKIKFPAPTHTVTKDRVKSRIRYKENSIYSFDEKTLHPAVTVEEAFCGLPHLLASETNNTYESLPTGPYGNYIKSNSYETTLHTAVNHSDKTLTVIKNASLKREDIPKPIRPETGYSSTYSRLYKNEPSVTLTTNYTAVGGTRCIHPYENRTLSPREGARIQSFPDSFTFEGSKGSITTQIGNAVPPLLGKAIAHSINSMF